MAFCLLLAEGMPPIAISQSPAPLEDAPSRDRPQELDAFAGSLGSSSSFYRHHLAPIVGFKRHR